MADARITPIRDSRHPQEGGQEGAVIRRGRGGGGVWKQRGHEVAHPPKQRDPPLPPRPLPPSGEHALHELYFAEARREKVFSRGLERWVVPDVPAIQPVSVVRADI